MYYKTEETMAYKIAEYLVKFGPSSISELARNLGKDRANVVAKLYLRRRRKYVKDEFINTIAPTGGMIQVHQWTITPKGRKWVK